MFPVFQQVLLGIAQKNGGEVPRNACGTVRTFRLLHTKVVYDGSVLALSGSGGVFSTCHTSHTGIGSRMGTAKVVASLTVMAKDMEGLSGTAAPGMDSSASGIPRTRGQARLSRTGRILP